MAKGKKVTNAPTEKRKTSAGGKDQAAVKAAMRQGDPEFLWSMSHAPRIDQDTHWFQLLPAAFFTALVILLVRMHIYHRPMEQFFWSADTVESDITDFFSYFKMVAIVICAVVALTVMLYRLCTQSFTLKRCFAYIPMAVYSLLVLLSYAFSDYKEFALWGWNDRFEGTVVLLSYMVLLFYIINAINSERNVKFILYPLVVSSAFLSLVGILQSLDKDPFRTVLGQKLITPNTMLESGKTIWETIDQAASVGDRFLKFTFQNKEIYQTVYNINYVSFYLTLLIPLFGMLFIRSINRGKEEPIWKKIGWGVLFAMLVYNLIGSASSGGFLGLGVVGLVGIIVLNKRILQWWKPVVIMLVIMAVVSGATYERWMPELTNAINGVLGRSSQQAAQEESAGEDTDSTAAATVTPGSIRPHIDYIETNERDLVFSVNGNPLTIEVTTTDDGAVEGIILKDEAGTILPMFEMPDDNTSFSIGDDRFRDYMTLSYAYDGTNYYVLIDTPGTQWPFAILEDQIYYRNQLGKMVDLYQVPHIGWENNDGFGSGRGYIWSRTLPMIKDTLLLGHGADTYCIYFPHEDYAGKYSSQTFAKTINIIVDKPHNMFMGATIGTGLLSVLALLALWIIYFIQSCRLYLKHAFDSYLAFVGGGIFFGIVGFIVAGLVNDSSASIMPLFYGLLGMGIAINQILSNKKGLRE